VPSGAVIEAFTSEASDGQLTRTSTLEDLRNISFDPIHPLTGPVYVEGAAPGDVLAVTLHEIEVGDWGWSAVIPGFGFLAGDAEFANAEWYRAIELGPGATTARLAAQPRLLGRGAERRIDQASTERRNCFGVTPCLRRNQLVMWLCDENPHA
jgi:hypothetical protein